MPTPFESFVNIELPKRVSTLEDGGGSGNLPEGKVLETTGVGLGVRTADWKTENIISNWVAEEIINSHRILVTTSSGTVKHANSSILLDAHRILGLSLTAATIGGNVRVLEFGTVSEVSWNWIVDTAMFLGEDGVLTQTSPTTGFTSVVGFASSATSLFIRPRQAILLA